ncbi:hypothetical protein [Rugosimonospora africana]|uniref:Uncharacterized protein n=1 Tax=Rugosimonospora africana TaxID=556532 RepID=A0A8J3R0J9_9ACTN|nr:hypothetical protein [Rugosimonospora africana]GIH19358.1 hypothetical protein Raf01_75300 [Rugosimonospora africana]
MDRTRYATAPGYVIGHLDTGDEDAGDIDVDEPGIALCRLDFLGTADDWAFAHYDPATGTTFRVLGSGVKLG